MVDRLAILDMADRIMGDTSKVSNPNVLDSLARLRRTIVREVSKLVESAREQERESCAARADLMQLYTPSKIGESLAMLANGT